MEVAGGRRKPSGRDRLSSLPDCLLHAIISQLRSRQAVQTCALSRRWAHLWRGVSCIHIDSADFSNQERRHHQVYSRVQQQQEEEEAALAKLEDFADSFLFSRGQSSSSSPEPPLDALRLRVHRGGPRGDINMCRWIRGGLKLSPAALEVSGADGFRVSLTSLPGRVSGGGACRLTRFRLDNVVLQHDFRDLFPVLEDLEIINAVFASEIWQIASDTLTSLTLVNASSRSTTSICSVRIAAPRLASLRLESTLARLATISFNIMSDARACLAQASIRILDQTDQDHKPWSPEDDKGEPKPDNNREQIHNLRSLIVDSLSNVTSLHLSGFQETKQLVLCEVLNGAYPWRLTSMSSFPNLISLVLEDCDLEYNLRTLWLFLRSTPAISRLVLNNCRVSD
ncbi:hypothetical protein QYE76_068864 [Lolium multiflorum]|uniref:F-box domain-containing protein n=1 Tax=Lolium multiflorum TaxID=4521 RepID=A0AAD8SFM2_LOLMU|nr:hypothetical protein QYE76_068864 [Lolium multiflorum]